MSKFIIKKNMTTEQRMKAIKKASDAFNKKIGRTAKVRRTETPVMDRKYDGDNINAWSDAPQYADKYYGDRMRERNEYESNWD
jgi:hypothetical protein